MEIKGFIENSLNEWEGKIASIVFLPGCNLRCRYCHAGHLILHPEKLESIPCDQILRYLKRQQGWVDGVVITGGEPTLHGHELCPLIERIKNLSLEVMIETNGTMPMRLRELIDGGYVDALSMDVKAPLCASEYKRVTGKAVQPKLIRNSIHRIIASGLPHEFRVTVVPGLVGTQELERIARELDGAQKVVVQNFEPQLCLDPALRSVSPYPPEEMDTFRGIFSAVAQQCALRGRERAFTAQGAV